MTPRQARFALCIFVVLVAGVTVNALFLQGARTVPGKALAGSPAARPAPDRARGKVDAKQANRPPARAPVSGEGRRVASFRPDFAMIDTVPEPPEPEAGPATVRAIQRELKQQGYGAAGSNGIVQMPMRAAIMAYEHDRGLPLTGEATEALLKRLLLGGPAAADTANARKVRSAQAEQVVRTTQQWLAALGYQTGETDGRLSEETQRAIREFEMDQGLVPKGRVSGDLVARLGDIAGRTKSVAGR